MTDHEFEQRLARLLRARGEAAVEVVDPRTVAATAIDIGERNRGLLGGLRRIMHMNSSQRTVQFGLGAAAIALLVMFGTGVIGPGLFGQSGDSASPTAQPSASPSPILPSDAACTPVDFQAEFLAVGRYCVDDPFPVSMTFDITHVGWWPFEGADDTIALVNGTAWALAFFEVENVYANPCDREGGFLAPTLGPTVEDLVAALGSVEGYRSSDISEANLGGYSGTELTLSATDQPATCDEIASSWGVTPQGFVLDGSPVPTPARPARLWIGDVDGVRLVVARPLSPLPTIEEWADGMRDPDRHAGDLAELDAILASLRFNP